MPRTVFFQGFCLVLFSMLSLQPEAVRRSYWARHWACAVDVLELLAAESASARKEGRPVVIGGREDIMDNMKVTNTALKYIIVKLMTEQYIPSKQCMLAHVCMPNNDAAIFSFTSVTVGKADYRYGASRVGARFSQTDDATSPFSTMPFVSCPVM